MRNSQKTAWLLVFMLLTLLQGCRSLPPTSPASSPINHRSQAIERAPASSATVEKENAVVLFALGLLDTGYRFGGKNPDAGLDCSGMVSYIFQQAVGLRVSGSAADMARQSKPVDVNQLRPGDLVFFNTLNKPFSHVGLYIGQGRFVHAPSESGRARVRTENLSNRYFAARLEAARSLLE